MTHSKTVSRLMGMVIEGSSPTHSSIASMRRSEAAAISMLDDDPTFIEQVYDETQVSTGRKKAYRQRTGNNAFHRVISWGYAGLVEEPICVSETAKAPPLQLVFRDVGAIRLPRSALGQ
jgi:hypothetical protein